MGYGTTLLNRGVFSGMFESGAHGTGPRDPSPNQDAVSALITLQHEHPSLGNIGRCLALLQPCRTATKISLRQPEIERKNSC